jgi:hypothetical protein
VARFARYLREEKYITAQDAGGIRKRWEYGRRLLMDGKATTPNGNLRNGVLDALIGNATQSGYELSRREIQRRLQCGNAYQTEAELRQVLAQFATWDDLHRANFPPLEMPCDGEPFDPRDADERDRDAGNAGRRLLDHQDGFDSVCAEFWPTDTYGPLSTLAELAKYAGEMRELTERFLRRDEERERHLQALISAVDGDMSATWEAAETALRQE